MGNIPQTMSKNPTENLTDPALARELRQALSAALLPLAPGRGPLHRIGQHLLDVGVMVGRIGLVAGPEVEDAAVAALPAAAGAEHLAALEPGQQHQFVGRRDVEALAVHLLVGQLEILRQAGGDRLAARQGGGRVAASCSSVFLLQAAGLLEALEARLRDQAQLCGGRRTLADMAIFPFVRQFAAVEPDWFAAQPWDSLARWLSAFESSALFEAIMHKHAPWQDGQGSSNRQKPPGDGHPVKPGVTP